MNKTALHDIHESLGAKMVPFAGYNMPVSYSGIRQEHEAVRNGVGVFDVSHMGEFILKGERALELIQKVSSNDASKLVPGKVQYACMPNEEGGIVDDLLIYMLDEQSYMMVVNASNIDKDWDWISKHNIMGVEMHNISDKTTLLAVQGPKALQALESLTEMNLTNQKYYSFDKGIFCGYENVLVSSTGYTGAGGFEIYLENQYAEDIWNRIFESGAAMNIQPVGLGARDTLRLEMGFCLYGNDIDDTTSPIEAGLGWITKFSKEFVNCRALEQQKLDGVQKKLVGFVLLERGIPRQGYPILDKQNKNIGEVTSGTMSPSLGTPIGMGYVNISSSSSGSEIFIGIRGKAIRSEVVKMPFYKSQ